MLHEPFAGGGAVRPGVRIAETETGTAAHVQGRRTDSFVLLQRLDAMEELLDVLELRGGRLAALGVRFGPNTADLRSERFDTSAHGRLAPFWRLVDADLVLLVTPARLVLWWGLSGLSS